VDNVKVLGRSINVKNNELVDSSDLIKVDDIWLKLSKIMLEDKRFDQQNERLIPYK
jgi:hypothetical protein